MSKICLDERDLMYCIGGQLYSQAPDRHPRKATEIMVQVRDKFRSQSKKMFDDYYYIEIEKKEIEKYIADLLMSIEEFVELNLSQNEYDCGIAVDDESRNKYSFVTRDSVIDWRDDFVDLDAFINNVTRNILWLNKGNEISYRELIEDGEMLIDTEEE